MTVDTYTPEAPPEDEHQHSVQPHDLDAERSVLGAMLLSQGAVGDVTEILKAGDFYRPNHATIYDAMLVVFGRGEPVDALTVADHLAQIGELARVGSAAYLHEMIARVTTTTNVSYHAGIVADLAGRRRLVEAGARIAQIGMSRESSIDDARNAAEALLYDATEKGAQATDYIPLTDVMERSIDEIEAAAGGAAGATGVPTGFTDFDELTNGLHPGQLIIIAARPAIGKSTWAIDIARGASIGANMTSVVFSLEMSATEIGTRIIAAEARIDLQKLRKGMMADTDWVNLARASDRVSAAPLFVDDSPNMTMPEIRAKARRLKQQHNLKLVIIDYLQLMSSGKKVESRQQEVSEFSRALKLLAKELQVPVIALSQLNRGPEQRSDKKPQVSDLRESGSIEQDADIVVLLDRPELHEGPESPRAGEADLIVAKHRNGPTDTITVAFQGRYSRFTNMAQF